MRANWDDHRYFLAIAREHSLTAAGKALGVSQPTVSRRLEALETRMKVRLFDRTRHGYKLTAVGMDLFDTVQQVEADLAEADRKIFGLDLSILRHPDIQSVYRVRLFADFITDVIMSDVDLFEGCRPF